MDIILDEASKRKMKVWILDDSHFPSGYANGALKNASPELCRQSVICKLLKYDGAGKTIRFEQRDLMKPVKLHLSLIQKTMLKVTCGEYERKFDDDKILSVVAYGPGGEIIDLTGESFFEKPAGDWSIAVNLLSRNYGPHKTYINMMSKESCRVFIDRCYEPHFKHYKSYFGNVIAGFFSDEPELGNGKLYAKHNKLGEEQDLPWSKELEEKLIEAWGTDYTNYIPYLWVDSIDRKMAEKFRVCYMECVTKLVRRDFSCQIGDWCRAHGVKYIGHSIEDDDTHTCTGSGLGHYFRGLEGQDWAGIDDIGGQVIPQGEDEPTKGMMGNRNGGFYHYVLGKLAVSLAYFDEKKQGNSMCEIFGNYGWKSGVYEQKYLADHFLVRGINNFVPHAFSPKAYPDSDCPPHFYAHGHNPQYKAFGELCGYMNRVASCISGGKIIARVAIYYNAESDWAGSCMTLDKPARELYDHQIDYLFLPSDYRERAKEFKYIIVPEADYVPTWLAELENTIFVNAFPKNVKIESGKVVPLDRLAAFLEKEKAGEVKLVPSNSRIRILHYKGKKELYFVVNEGKETYRGMMHLECNTSEADGNWTAYDLWNQTVLNVKMSNFELEPRKSVMFIRKYGCHDSDNTENKQEPQNENTKIIMTKDHTSEIMKTGEKESMKCFQRSFCRSIEYPNFDLPKEVLLPDEASKENKKFSGFIRYETEFTMKDDQMALIQITREAEAVEVFVNGMSAGIQIVPDYLFDISNLIKLGNNTLRIETATTLERENNCSFFRGHTKGSSDAKPTGLLGDVFLYRK